MHRTIGFRIGASMLILTLGAFLIAPVQGFAQTQGMERRDDRRDDRGGARDTRQEGREAARDAKEECRDAGGKLIECGQEKRDVKQGARKDARDIKKND